MEYSGWDMDDVQCDCGETVSCDGHGLPFGTYCENAKTAFNSIDIMIPERIENAAWREILSFVQQNYSCDRFVSKQGDKTGFPGDHSTLFLHPRRNEASYPDIDEVPEISESTKWRILLEVPHITILCAKDDHLFLKEFPRAKEIMSRSIIREVREKKASEEYKNIGPLTFNGLVQAEAASHMTLIDGCNLQQCAESWGFPSYAELPLTREDVWKLVVGSRNGSEALATDIVYSLRRGKYAKNISEHDHSIMKRAGLPKWFPEYASMVVYLFPRAHCVEFAWHDLIRTWAE